MLNVKNNVYWVGKIDWELRKFHGNEYSTHKGSTYNSYLIKEEKTVLIDTVWGPYKEEFIKNLSENVELNKIDYIIMNHSEYDHSGALPELMKLIPDTPIYCTANGIKSIKGQFHQEWNFRIVKTGDKLDIGNGKELVFIETPMLHWPDSMFTYMTGDNILFSSDGFGQHYASSFMFNDKVNQSELFNEAFKYYANILTPFSALVIKKINEILSLKLPVDVICPTHGVIWRDNPLQIVTKYLEWANNYQENQITIIYDTMWNGTRAMAESIAEGIQEADESICVRLYNVATSDKNDVISEIFKSKAIAVGSPTVNKGVLSSIAAMLEEIKGLRFKNKRGLAFGTYGWSGESPAVINEELKKAGFEVENGELKATWIPDEDALERCRAAGKELVKNL